MLMKLTRKQFWLFLQACIVVLVLLYEAMWLMAIPTTGTVVGIDYGTGRYKAVKHALIEYEANGAYFSDYFLVDEDFSNYHTGQRLKMSYLPFAKASARVDGITAGTVLLFICYVIFFVMSAAIFIMPNYILGRYSIFIIYKHPPFVKYIAGPKRKQIETLTLIEKANLFAGYIEKFMLPFAASLVVSLFVYLITWMVELVILCIVAGSIWGIIRARKWRKHLHPDDPELDVLDKQPGWTDELN